MEQPLVEAGTQLYLKKEVTLQELATISIHKDLRQYQIILDYDCYLNKVKEINITIFDRNTNEKVTCYWAMANWFTTKLSKFSCLKI